jgi:membrane protease YdiL (CAAX protease family)
MAIVLTFGLFLLFGIVSVVAEFDYGLVMAFGELVLIIIPLCYMFYRRVNIGNYVGLKLRPKYILLGITFGALLFLFNIVVSNALISLVGESEAVRESNNLILNMAGSWEGLVLVTIGLSLAGVCEEFTFRGFLQTAVNSKYSFGISLLVSSLAFGFFHVDLQLVYTLAAFFMGLVLGYIYHRWHSYIVSATAHATMNLIVLALALLIH